jgi:pimeloyl-ACP methyl ester carboxylesterase
VTAVQHVESADGTPIAYRASGSGPGLVLVHGTATSGIDWLPVTPLLREQFTVVTMDRRGRGDSGDGADYAQEREAEDVLAVLDAVGAELLVAHSYGAMCSIRAAEQSDRIRRLVLYEPPIGVSEELLEDLDDLIAADRREEALEGFLRGAGAPESQFDQIRSSRAWPFLLDAVPAMPRELRAAAAWRHPQGPIEVPTLFLLGGETTSPVYLDGLDGLLAAFTDLRRQSIPGQLHVGHVFAPEAFAGLVIEFCG